MATNPSASVTVSETAGAVTGGVDLVCLMGPVTTNADAVPRLFGSAAAVQAQHGYSELVELAALHAAGTRKSMLVCGLPIATPGVVGREDTSGNTGTCVTTVAAGGNGVLTEHDGVATVLVGGTIGTSPIILSVSLDGGRVTKRVRLGTASSYAIPNSGVTMSFAAGTLVAGDTIHTWHGSGPKSDSTGWALAFAALAAQQRLCRTIVLVGDLDTDTEAAAFLALLDAYETVNQRDVQGRVSVTDRLPLAATSSTSVAMTGSASLTFAEVGTTGDTITRSTGSFISDGFVAGMILTIAGTTLNDGTHAAGIASVSALELTLDTDDLVDESAVASVTLTAVHSLTFSDSADTITRSGGSWIDDGFRPGDVVTVVDSASNNGTFNVTAVTDLVLTLGSGDLADEVVQISAVTAGAGQTKAAWMAALETEFTPIDDSRRIDLSAGRGRVTSPLTQWYYRRPAAWAASVREYQHDLHIPTWRKDDGPTGYDLYDAEGSLVEWDDFVDGGAGSAARFTTFRSWPNGPNGAFIAQSLTRALDSSLLVQTHNSVVVNLAQTVTRAATEAVIGRVLTLNSDGTATAQALSLIEREVNSKIEQALLADRGEGPRASQAVWTASTDDVLNVPEALMTGVLELNLGGTIHSISTTLRVVSGGN